MGPRWLPRATFSLALIGIGASGYLTYAHFTSPTVLVCSGSGPVNCVKVTTSAQSRFLGIPVAVIGLIFWLVMAGLLSRGAWRARSVWVRRTRLALISLGMLFVLWLVYAEFAIIHALCLWCTVVHVVTFASFVLVLLYGMDVSEDVPG